MRAEYRVWPRWIDGELYGTLDADVHSPFRRLTVIDFKYGKGVVEAQGNVQLGIYALDPINYYMYDEVELAIVQPRAWHKEGPVRSYLTTPERLEKWAREVVAPAAKETRKPNAPLFAGDHCKWCLGKPGCPARIAATFGEVEKCLSS